MIDARKNTFVVRVLRRLGYWICRTFFRIEHTGVENIPAKGPLIIAANHQTYLDPLFVALPIHQKMHYMTWHKAFYVPLLAPFIRWLGAFPVNIDRPDRQAFHCSLEFLHAGDTLIIFPEGGRSKDGAIRPFKPGLARLALGLGTPILPVTIQGGEKVWPPKQWLPRTGKIRIHYHKVIPVEPTEGSDRNMARTRRQALTEQVRTIIANGLQSGKDEG
jgi:1-acyl-sn-glycerol-3-phosphate acyltransferase